MGNAPSSGNAHVARFLAGCPEIPPAPPESDVLAAFDALLDARQIPALVASELKAVETLDTKWMYVFLSQLPAENVAKDWLEPRECVLKVFSVQQHDEVVHGLFCAIRINVVLRGGDWVEKFVAADGVSALAALTHGPAKSANPAVLEEALSVLFALAVFGDALVEMAEADGCCNSMLAVLESSGPRPPKARALKLLGFMCRHSKAVQEIVVSAIASTTLPGERRFRSICQQFAESAGDVAVQIAVVSFLSDLLEPMSSLGEAGLPVASSPGKASVSKPPSLLQSLENFFTGSPAPTPSKPSGTAKPRTSTWALSREANQNESSSSNANPDGTEDVRKTAAPTLTLPFFQSFRRGPGLGATPACTPIASASVRKDGKRHSFSSFASLPSHSESEIRPAPPVEELSSALPKLLLAPIVPADEKPSLTVALPSRLEPTGDEDAVRATAAAPPPTSTDLSKFRKLLSMGAPKDAVRAKMRQAGVNPDLLDERLGFDAPAVSLSLPLTTPTAAARPDPVPPAMLSSAPDVSKFRKLLSMGAPLAAVKAKMVQAGLDPALLDQKAGFSGVAASPEPTAMKSTEGPSTSVATVEDADVSKFKKLLSMGAPLAAVKAKMVQAGVDPALLDKPIPTVVPAAAPPESPVQRRVLVKDDPEYAKFFKLHAMGAPVAAVKAKMRQAGLNSDLFDTPGAELPGPNEAPTSGPAAGAAPEAKPNVLVKEDPEYAKFFKLLSMGAPAASVKCKMQMAGLKPELLDTPDAVLSGPDEANGATPQVLVKDDPEYAKFFKLLLMGAPAATVKAKMQMAGLKPELLDTPDAPLKAPAEVASKPLVFVKDDPEYAKFFKLLAMGAPAEMVKGKMQIAGLKPELLDTPDAVLNPPASAAESKPQVLVKDDPEYAKFFKLLLMGAPAATVKAKMQMAGLKPELLDTPDAILTPATPATAAASAVGTDAKPATNAARRAHLSISIKPPAKQTTRSFYWQQLRGDAIKGTVWEEIEKERSVGHNNELPLILNESDLAALESEFPPPQAATGPGTRGRTNSIDNTVSAAPGSPLASPRVVFLIDRSRANNVSIIIKQFRISNAALREAIMKLDASVLTLERVQGLLKIMPTEEEIAAIMGFQGDPLTLNEAERILKELISVPRLKQRLSALQAKLQFPTLVRDLQTKVEKLRAASTELSQSAELKTTLLVVLQVGNKMNQGTNRGDAKGFRLGDLTKLAQMKSVDRGVTLLHFVARMLRLKKGNLVRLSDALSSLYDVQNIPIPELQGDMAKVAEVTENVGNELSAQKLKNSIEEKESCDLFVKVMDEFMSSASATTAALKSDLDSTMQLLKDTMQRFDKDTDADEPAAVESAGPPSAASMASACEFLSTVYEFSVALTKADRENDLRRLKEERQLKLQQQKSQLPVRSHSSVDLLSGLPERGKTVKAGEAAGPETLERPLVKKDSASKIPGRGGSSLGMSPVTRSVSLSSIVELKPTGADSEAKTAAAATAAKKSGKTPEKPAMLSKMKKPATEKTVDAPLSKAPLSTARTTKREEPSSKIGKPLAKDKAASKAKTMMAVPGKIIKATKQSSNVVSPLKIVPTAAQLAYSPSTSAEISNGANGPLSSLKKLANSSIEKSMRRASSGERVVPFDDEASSLEDIRNKLARKHSTPAANARHQCKPETSESETELLYDNNSRPPSPKAVQAAEQAVAPRTQPDAHRRLASASALDSFRAVQAKGMRGFLEGGAVLSSSPDKCAAQCAADALCLSFDFETVTLACYISHTDRYAHPEAFLSFPTGVYYEWQGQILPPELEPNGGSYSTQVAIRLYTSKLGAVIYYRVEALDAAAALIPTAEGLFGSSQKFGVAKTGELIVLPPFSCQIFAMAVKEGANSSAIVVSNEFSIYASKYAFLVPYFNGAFHGRVARLKLDVKGKKRPRPARFLEFSDYESSMGIGPYRDQVSVVNLTALHPDFKGFYGGFTGFAPTAFVNETFTEPAPDDPNYTVLKWRLVFEAQYSPHAKHTGFGVPPRVLQDSEYLYLAPYFNGDRYLGTVIRILALSFSGTPFIEQLNVSTIDPELRGFGSSFIDGKFAYFVPRENEGGLFGKMVRISVDTFNVTGVSVLDLAAIDPRFVGFSSAFTYNNYAYLVPLLRPLTFQEKTTNLREFPVSNSGVLVRVNLKTFASAEALDLAQIHPELVGFSGAALVANHAFLIPYMRRRVPSPAELNPYGSFVARVDLRDFRSVAYLDLAQVDPDLRGFMRGFAYKQFVFFVPSRAKYFSPGSKTQSGKVARLDTTKFSADGVSVLDLASAYRSQVPDRPDDSLRGFSGGFVSGKYGFFVPFFDGGLFSGKVCRINLEKFNEVQTLDLAMLDEALRGYSGGIVSRTHEPLDADLFGEFQMRQGTMTPYDYIY
ncbi:hypothetical protein PybrP1_000050 [[Pythium] brassicae (nom. inval.)]|nr:hypothetical protein PybrP1_000050 [[Pythium] brassicae (nom. inval.)]